jgi:hypothetical protein
MSGQYAMSTDNCVLLIHQSQAEHPFGFDLDRDAYVCARTTAKLRTGSGGLPSTGLKMSELTVRVLRSLARACDQPSPDLVEHVPPPFKCLPVREMSL